MRRILLRCWFDEQRRPWRRRENRDGIVPEPADALLDPAALPGADGRTDLLVRAMDIDEIKNGLRGVALAEPPLGFDPDDIATRAATSMRNRRAVIGTGLVVACLAAVAVGIASDRGQSRDTAPAERALAEERAHIDQHLRDVLPGILPNATDSVGQFTEPSPDFPLRATTGTVITFRDDAGPAYF